LRFLYDGPYEEYRAKLIELGSTPIPKFIEREPDAEDDERFQTVFAKETGAVSAPSAGLHFSKHLLKRMEIKGIEKAEVTLHVGLGAFRDVEVEDLSKHKMDSEEIHIREDQAEIVNTAIKGNHKVCIVGTTTMRTVESSVSTKNTLNEVDGWTNKFIFAPYEFRIADAMITNFHLPKSTLMMMVSAFCGHDLLLDVYKVAVKEKYRFHTYGDAMLIID